MPSTVRAKVTSPQGDTMIIDVPTSIVNSKGEVTDNDAFEALADDAFANKAATRAGGPKMSNPALPGIIKSMNRETSLENPNENAFDRTFDPVHPAIRAAEAFAGGRPVAGVNNIIDSAGSLATPLGGEALVNAPLKTALTAAAGYTGSRVGEEAGKLAGTDSDTTGLLSRLGAIFGGSQVASPKVRGAEIGGAQAARANIVPAMAAGIGMKYLGAPKWLDAAVAGGIEAPAVARGIKYGASGRPLIDPDFFGRDPAAPRNSPLNSDKVTNVTFEDEPKSNVVQASVGESKNSSLNPTSKLLEAPKKNVQETNEVVSGKDVKGDVVNLDKVLKFFKDKNINPWELTPEEYKKAGYNDVKANAGNTELTGDKTYKLLLEHAKSKGLPTYDNLKPAIEGKDNKTFDIKPDVESKIIIPKSHVEAHAKDNGIEYDEAESHYPKEEFEILDRRAALNRLHGVAKEKGSTHSNLSDLARDTHSVKGLGDPKLEDTHIIDLINDLMTRESNPVKTTPKSAIGLDKDPTRGLK